jgi:hypothetical protein
MSIERLKNMKDSLMSCVEGQFSDLKNTDTHELGEAIDMIKDLSEAVYYCTVTEAMDKKEDEQKNIVYYTMPVSERRDSMLNKPPVMYMGPDTYGNIGNTGKEISYYEDGMNMRTMGTSPISRKMYMEAKDMHKGNAV